MITIKKPEEIEILRESGRRLAEILKRVSAEIKPGVSTKSLDKLAFDLAKEGGDEPAFLNYKPDKGGKPFPATLCVSVNEGLVHGLPTEERVLKEGDIVSIDMGLIHRGMITDSAITLPVGEISKENRKLLDATREAMSLGIKAAKPGGNVGDIGFAVESFSKPLGYSLAEGLAGHGVGYEVHEDPYVPNTGRPGEGPELKPGMVIAIEPMLCLGKGKIAVDSDGFTIKTADGSLSAHFEHTVAITPDGPEILTKT